MTDTPKDVVYLPVPEHLARQVRDYIAFLVAHHPEGESAESIIGSNERLDSETEATTAEDSDLAGREWPNQDVYEVAQKSTYTDLKTFLDILSSRPGEWLRKDDLERDGQLNPNLIKGELSGLTRKYTYNRGKKTWFFEYRRRSGVSEYKMRDRFAVVWRAAREADGVNFNAPWADSR